MRLYAWCQEIVGGGGLGMAPLQPAVAVCRGRSAHSLAAWSRLRRGLLPLQQLAQRPRVRRLVRRRRRPPNGGVRPCPIHVRHRVCTSGAVPHVPQTVAQQAGGLDAMASAAAPAGGEAAGGAGAVAAAAAGFPHMYWCAAALHLWITPLLLQAMCGERMAGGGVE